MPNPDVAPIGYYTASEVARLAGVSPRRIGRWSRDGYHPSRVFRSDRTSTRTRTPVRRCSRITWSSRESSPVGVRKIVAGLRKDYGDWP